ncbi:MAG TPA: hypothetical protein VKX49_08710 [Bryobacteraceae bacterium]|nr:hypothetical protein [Bryobacteraceae bacterium]
MVSRTEHSFSVFAGTVATVLLAVSPAVAQTTAAVRNAGRSANSGTLARTPNGEPDLQGIWTNATITPLERPRDLGSKALFTPEEATARERQLLEQLSTDRRDGPAEVDVNRSYNELWRERGHLLLRTSLIVDPPDGRLPPLTPEAQKREQKQAEDRHRRGPDPADSWTDRNLAERCITRGAPKLPGGYNNNFQIIQTRDAVAIMQEMIHETRVIRLDGSPHADPNIRLWMGDSRGHWEGDTLVVDTTNYNNKILTNSFNCCPGAGENLHVIERFRRVDADHIDYRYTVDDPTVYTRPWTAEVPMTRIDGQLYEYACHEGNYAMQDMLAGARAREAAQKPGQK